MAQSSQYTEEMLLDSPTMDTQAATEPVQEPRGSGERQNVQQLADQIRELGRPQPQTPATLSAHEGLVGAINMLERFDDWDAHVLLAYAKRRVDKERGADHVFCGHRRSSFCRK